MPYFIYRVIRFRHLEMADEAPSYDQALARAKSLRAKPHGRADSTVKLIFAETEHQAEIAARCAARW
jgi:hypothetical protein